MNDSEMRLHRRKQVEMEQRNALLGTMIRHLENMIADLDGEIATKEDRSRTNDRAHPTYSTFARAAAKRRGNLLTSMAHVKSLLEVANRELDEVAMQSRNLECIQNHKPEDISQ
jgi:flagellar FliJ protein